MLPASLSSFRKTSVKPYGSIEVWEYFKKLTEQAAKQLQKAKDLQLKNLESPVAK